MSGFKSAGTPGVFRLLDEVVDTRFAPEGFKEPKWTVTGTKAYLNWDAFGGMYMRTSREYPGGQVLVVVPPPPLLPLVEQLHAEGWRRGGWHEQGCWDVYAYIRRYGAEVRVLGMVGESEVPEADSLWALFSPPPPPVSRRKGFKAEHEEWVRKGREDEW